jgi:DNA-binding Lrp family transcriptional regulator
MRDRFDPLDVRLLEEFQRDLPLVPHPFAAMAAQLGCDEAEVIARLSRLQSAGAVARVGATVRPNTAGASTLAALSVPEDRLDEVAELVGAEPGVNHSYLREHDWNLWFVATASDRAALAALLTRIGQATGLQVLDLPLVRPFNIDLGFRLEGPRHSAGMGATPDLTLLTEADRPLLAALSRGLPLVPQPFAAVGAALNRTGAEVIDRIATLSRAGILTRVGVIVRHRPLGWTSNAMVTFDLPPDRIETAGRALAAHPGVTLCYQRRTVPGVWDWGLFCMIHGRSRAESLGILTAALTLPELHGARHQVLFSLRCFKQTGAHLTRAEVAA